MEKILENLRGVLSRLAYWYYSQRVRSIFIQVCTLSLVIVFVVMLVHTTAYNLQRQNIATGFGFLSERSGFAISQVPITYSEDSSYFRAFVVGILNTIIVSAVGIVTATFLGFFVAISRLSSNFLLSKMATVFVEIFRNIPPLLQIFFWYFVVLRSLPVARESLVWQDMVFLNNRGLYIPALIFEAGSWVVAVVVVLALVFLYGSSWHVNRRHMDTGKRPSMWPMVGGVVVLVALVVWALGVPFHWEFAVLEGFNFRGGMIISPEFLALYCSLTLYTASYIAENVRSGILAVPKGQIEAARALGLSRGITLRKVVIPQAMRVIVPPLTGQYLNLTKNSSLAVAIGYPDLVSVFAGTVLNQTGQAVEVVAMTMAVYLVLSLSISLFMNYYNEKTMLRER